MNSPFVPTTTFDVADKTTVKAGDSRGLAVLLGMSSRGKHIYAGTVPAAEVERRRVKGRAARRARRLNRGRR